MQAPLYAQTTTYLADILVHLLWGERLLVLIVTKQPEAGCAVIVVVGDVQVVSPRLKDALCLMLGRGLGTGLGHHKGALR